MRLRISFKKIKKFTILITIIINVTVVSFTIWEIFLIGAKVVTKNAVSIEGAAKMLDILATKDVSGIKEQLKEKFGTLPIDSDVGLKEFLSKNNPNDTAILSIDDIKRKIKTGGTVAIYSLFLCGIILILLEISKKVLIRERRRHERYDTEAKVYFTINYEVKTNVQFQIVDKKEEQKTYSQKYSAICKNVSVEGMCFTSSEKLEKGNLLYLEVFVPEAKEPVHMEGEVRWSQALSKEQESQNKFDAGIKLILVEGKSVMGSIHYDQANKIIWSIVLESIFGNFSRLQQAKSKKAVVRA